MFLKVIKYLCKIPIYAKYLLTNKKIGVEIQNQLEGSYQLY